MSEIVIAVISAILGSSVLTCILNFVFEMIKRKSGVKSASEKALCMTMLFILKETASEYMKKEEITVKELESFNATYQCYKELGGDGWADEVHELVNELKKVL